MKKYLYFLLAIATLLSCHKDNKEKEINECCGAPFKYFYLKVNRNLVNEDFTPKFSLTKITNVGNEKVELRDFKRFDSAVIFEFAVIYDLERSLIERSEIYDLKTAKITITGQFKSIPNCCNTPQINKVLLNGKEWVPEKDPKHGYNIYTLEENQLSESPANPKSRMIPHFFNAKESPKTK